MNDPENNSNNYNKDFKMLPFSSHEITELYIGWKMPNLLKEQIISLAVAVNPKIKIFHTILDGEKIVFIRDHHHH